MNILRSFDSMQKDALGKLRVLPMRRGTLTRRGTKTEVLCHQSKDLEVELWKAAELGCHLAVEEVLQNPNIDPNKPHKETDTTLICGSLFWPRKSGESPS